MYSELKRHKIKMIANFIFVHKKMKDVYFKKKIYIYIFFICDPYIFIYLCFTFAQPILFFYIHLHFFYYMYGILCIFVISFNSSTLKV